MDPINVDCGDRTMQSPEQAKLLVQIYGFVYVNIIYYLLFLLHYYIILYYLFIHWAMLCISRTCE
jgi:hypothetical protein